MQSAITHEAPCPEIFQNIHAVTRPCRTQDWQGQLIPCRICASQHLQSGHDQARTIVPASASARAGATSGGRCVHMTIDPQRAVVMTIYAIRIAGAMTNAGRSPPTAMTPDATGLLIRTRAGNLPASAMTSNAAIETASAHATTKIIRGSRTTTRASASALTPGAMRLVRKTSP